MRRLFIVGAKIVGLVCLFWAITTALQFISYIVFSIRGLLDDSFFYVSTLIFIISVTAYLILSIWFSIVLLFRTEWLANKLKLEKDSDLPNWPELNTLLNLGIILAGLFILATAIPSLVRSTLTMLNMLFRIREVDNIFRNIVFPYLVMVIADIFKILIGLIFVLMPGRLVSFTERCQKKFDYKPAQAEK